MLYNGLRFSSRMQPPSHPHILHLWVESIRREFQEENIMSRILTWVLCLALAALACFAGHAADDSLQGFTPLFNGKDLSGWKVPPGDNDHWKVVNGVIDYDARSEGEADKCLWTDKSYRDFILRIDWRLKK